MFCTELFCFQLLASEAALTSVEFISGGLVTNRVNEKLLLEASAAGESRTHNLSMALEIIPV